MQAEGAAWVTGASRGLGRALALELAGRGFDVVAGARDPAAAKALPEAARALGGRLRVARLDVERPETIDVPQGLRVLVNNAGIDAEVLPLETTPLALWRRLFETNLFGLVEVTRRAIPALRNAGGGVICNITSASLLFPMPFYAAYRASKAAVSALGESLRAELAPFGIRVLEVLPGPIDTDMLARSDHPPEALAHAAYRPLAERTWAGRQAIAGSSTPAPDAARSIADAILAGRGPLRCGCDALGEGLLAGWRQAPDEAWMERLLQQLAPGVQAAGTPAPDR